MYEIDCETDLSDSPAEDWIPSNFCVTGYEQFVKLLLGMVLRLANCNKKERHPFPQSQNRSLQSHSVFLLRGLLVIK